MNVMLLSLLFSINNLAVGQCWSGEAYPWSTAQTLTAIRYRDEILRPIVRPFIGVVSPGFILVHVACSSCD